MKKLKVGVVGFGGSALAISRILSKRGDATVLAVFDPRPAGRQRAASSVPAASVFEDLDAFWSSGIDAVAVCSPDRSHADYVVGAIQRGLHVLCEKPLTDSLQGVRRITAAAMLRPDVVVAVQHQMRFLLQSQAIKRLFEAGDLGTVSYMEGYYVHDLRSRAWVNDTWRLDDNATPLVYCGCHFVDLLRWWIADEVVEVYAVGNHLSFREYPESDLNVLLLKFASGAIGKVLVSFGSERPQDHSVRVLGSIRSIDESLLWERSGFRVIARPSLEVAETVTSSWRATFANARARMVSRLVEYAARISRLPAEYAFVRAPLRLYEHSLAVQRSVEDFVEAVATSRQPLCTIDEAARCVEICLAGVESMRSGRPVLLAEFIGQAKA